MGFDCSMGMVTHRVYDGRDVDMFVVVLTLSGGFGGEAVGNYAPVVAILEQANNVTLSTMLTVVHR